MKYKEDVERSIEKAEQLALTLETAVSTPRLANPTELKRLATEIRQQIKFIADRVSLEYES